MLKILLFIGLILPSFAQVTFPDVEKVMGLALKQKVLPGAVTVIGTSTEVLQRKSYGKRDTVLNNSLDTIYDLASVTKVVATATSIMILEEQGKIKTSDKLSLYYPEFNSSTKEDVTIEDLLRHRSGLPASTVLVDDESYEQFISRIVSSPLAYNPGTKTVYSDIGFILLGDIIQRVSKMTLHQFSKTYIFDPLRMNHTGFSVPEEDKKLCAPTLPGRFCVPHDPKAFRYYPLNLGHAGLFSTADDLSRLARMYLNGGTFEGVTILNQESVEKMTVLPLNEIRGLGWDLLSPYADAPRGDLFPKGISYGHTGYTGTSIWIDPLSKTYYVFLANRVLLGDERTAKPFTVLRRRVSTAIAKALSI